MVASARLLMTIPGGYWIMSKVLPEPTELCPMSDGRRQMSLGELMSTPSGRNVILFDGHCRFCVRQSQRIVSLAQPGSVEAVNFQDPGALDRFPGVTHESCMRAIHLIEPKGRISRGPEAIIRAIATRPIFRWLTVIFWI